METEDIIKIGTGVAGSAATLYRIWKEYNKKSVRSFEEFLTELSKVKAVCRKANKRGIPRIIMFVGTKKNKRYARVSAVDEAMQDPDDTVMEDYQNFEPDDHYNAMLLSLSDNETTHSIEVITEELPPCRLKEVYEGVVGYARVMRIHKTRTKLFYMSLATPEDHFSPEAIRQSNVIQSQISAVFQKYF